jgi:tetratricopeptide (TPR) repeat protein
MKTKNWVASVLAGTIFPLLNFPVLAESITSQPIGKFFSRTDIDCQKLPSGSAQSSNTQSTTESRELEKIIQAQKKVKELFKQGRLQDAILLADQLLKTLKTKFPNSKKELAISLRHRGFLYETQGEDKKAESLYWEALTTLNLVENWENKSILIRDSLGKIAKQGSHQDSIDLPEAFFRDRFCDKNNRVSAS